MGRGRQKAKQTKVARELKYFSPDTDYNALQRELHGPDPYLQAGRTAPVEAPAKDQVDDDTETDDESEDWSRYSATDDYDDWASKRRA